MQKLRCWSKWYWIISNWGRYYTICYTLEMKNETRKDREVSLHAWSTGILPAASIHADLGYKSARTLPTIKQKFQFTSDTWLLFISPCCIIPQRSEGTVSPIKCFFPYCCETRFPESSSHTQAYSKERGVRACTDCLTENHRMYESIILQKDAENELNPENTTSVT